MDVYWLRVLWLSIFGCVFTAALWLPSVCGQYHITARLATVLVAPIAAALWGYHESRHAQNKLATQ